MNFPSCYQNELSSSPTFYQSRGHQHTYESIIQQKPREMGYVKALLHRTPYLQGKIYGEIYNRTLSTEPDTEAPQYHRRSVLQGYAISGCTPMKSIRIKDGGGRSLNVRFGMSPIKAHLQHCTITPMFSFFL